MKKSFIYIFAAFLTLGVTGCSDKIESIFENVTNDQPVAKLNVTGSICQDDETRVALNENGDGTSITPTWEVDDHVFGFYGSDSKLTYRVASVTDGVATFTLEEGTEPTDGTTIYMVYAPGKSATDITDGQLAVDLSQQDGTLAGVKNHAIMCATATVEGSSLDFQFKNQVAILGVKQFTGLKASTTYTSATFTSAGPTATVKVEGGVLKLVTDDAYGTITATGSFASDASGNTTETIYFAVPPTEAVEHQFTLVCDDDYRIGAISAKAVAAGKYLYMSSKALRECVDLGLPSHTLWAATNIGATTPEGFGDYYAWGEVETQASGRYWWDSYKWGNASSSNSGLTKYNSTDGLTRLLPEDDAATVNWKNSWRIPTKTEFDELINTTYTTLDWTTQNGVSGMKITSKVNGKSIFLPAAGLKDYGYENRDPGACNYPTSDLMTNEMSHCHNYKYNSNRQNSNYGRCGGRPVRAVIAPMATYNNSANATTGTAPVLSSAGCPNNECGWVQLWAGGPKWAVFNVGVTDGKTESFGGYYAWGGCQDKIDDHNTGSVTLIDDNDTATKLWGNAWCMPTGSEIQALLDNCACIWTTLNGVNGFLCTGRGSYSCNSVFLPATGGCGNGRVDSPGGYGNYWSSTPDESKAVHLSIQSHAQNLWSSDRHLGFAVRAVLKEQ